MKSHVDYEAAFENYLQTRQIAYVAVDEAKRAAFRDAKLKSFDFIVYGSAGAAPRRGCAGVSSALVTTATNWLVDIKGRRWAPRRGGARPAWENWVTQADLDGLRQWQEVFGPGFAALLVFAYRLDAAGEPPPDVIHEFRGARYVFTGVTLDDYERSARLRSPKWGTVNMPVREFAQRVRPIADWL